MPTGRCPTAECSWPLTPSLGVCSSCNDVTSQIWLNEYLLPDTVEYRINDTLGNTSLDLTFVNYIQFALVGSVNPLHIQNSPDGRLLISQAHVLGVSPSNYRSFLQALSEVPDNAVIRPIPQDKVRPLVAAYTCSLYFCIQAFTAKITAGAATQTLQQTWDQFSHTNDGFWTPIDVPPTTKLSNPSTYRVENQSLNVLGNAFAQILIGNVEVWDSGITNPLPENIPLPTFVGPGKSLLGTFTEAVWRASDSTASITKFFDQVATSFTNFMRTAPSLAAAEDGQYAPVVYTNEIYVHVRWGWLAFPLAVLFLGHVFLVLTMRQTRRRRVQPWKGARIPLLLAGVDDMVKEAAKGGLLGRSGLEERVGQIKFRLGYDDGDKIAFERVP